MVDVEVARKAILFRMPRRRRAAAGTPASGGRRKKMAVAKLGGDGGDQRRRFFRRLRVRWVAALYRRTLRRLRASYAKAIRDLIDGKALLGNLRTPVGVGCSEAASFGPMATVGF